MKKLVAFLSFVLLTACPPGPNSPTPGQVFVNTVPSDLGFTVCAAGVYEADTQKGKAAGLIVADVVALCSAQLASIIATVATPPSPEALAVRELGPMVARDLASGKLSQGAANVRLAEFYSAAHLPLPKLLVAVPAKGAP